MCTRDFDGAPLVIQIILSECCTIYDILLRFDLDACRVAYNPRLGIIASPMATLAWEQNKIMFVTREELQFTKGHMCRLRKYLNKGFDTTESLRGELHRRITRELQRRHLEATQEEVKSHETKVCLSCRANSIAYTLAAERQTIVPLENMTQSNRHVIVLRELIDLITFVSQPEPPLLMDTFATAYRKL
jgi:hypothetical protein